MAGPILTLSMSYSIIFANEHILRISGTVQYCIIVYCNILYCIFPLTFFEYLEKSIFELKYFFIFIYKTRNLEYVY